MQFMKANPRAQNPRVQPSRRRDPRRRDRPAYRATPAAAVLVAYFAAREAGRPPIDCYKAGVDVWKCLHPDHAPAYAARCAVRVILDEIQEHMMDVSASPLGGHLQQM
jgi:hypothetical protein